MEMGRILGLSFAAVLSSLILQGCEFNVPRHEIGNWEAKPSYLDTFEFSPSGKSSFLNSCSNTNLTSALQCSGHGRCRDYFSGVGSSRLAFCDCDLYWADPECRTARKSQVTAFVLSMFLGFFGVDQFYLGYVWYGLFKLITFGGGGLWYLYDLCRIGSSTVLTARNFRVAADLPHFAFVLSVVTAMLFFGFLFSILSILSHRYKKAHEVMMIRIQAEDDAKPEEPMRMAPRLPPTAPLKPFVPFSGYGTTIPSGPVTTAPLSSRIISAPAVPTASAVPTEFAPAARVTTLPARPIVASSTPVVGGTLPLAPISSTILPTSSAILPAVQNLQTTTIV